MRLHFADALFHFVTGLFGLGLLIVLAVWLWVAVEALRVIIR